LRKIVGREAISTVSKHGYRFALAVTGEPGVARTTYARFIRANELAAQRSLQSMNLARELYWACLAEDPGFASAWAWLGRCSWFLAKFGGSTQANAELAEAAFRRAFALDPDLACAHQFFTLLQADIGLAGEAATRLLERLERHPGEPESYAGLVQVYRFRGLLAESMDAHRRAVELDPSIVTSVAHSLFFAGQFSAAIESYTGRAAYYLDAASWAALGETQRAAALLSERLARMSLSHLMTALMSSLMALLHGKCAEAIEQMKSADATRDPEILVYFARHYSRMGLPDSALDALRRAAQAGFVCAPMTLTSDPWLEALRSHAEFRSLLNQAESAVERARIELKSGIGRARTHRPLPGPQM
jgi:tetratricopeptide (TPR) repeat protein